jgi:hypothetical protein
LAAKESILRDNNSSERKLNKKVDRSESIRRAEEMLTTFLKEQA